MKNNWWQTHRWELLGVMVWLAAAILFRTRDLLAVPPGLHYDEAIDLRQALNIVAGARPLYVAEGWGREALFYYLVAGMLKIVAYNPLALRLTAVFCSLITIGVAYLWVRRLWSWPVAWFAAAWLSLTFWTVSTSRVGVRNIALPLTFSLTVLFFWYAWQYPSPSHGSRWPFFFARGGHWYSLAGFFLGLTLYTYQPARFTPFVFVAFVIYVALWHRPLLKEKWPGLLLMASAAALTAWPLLLVLSQSRGAEFARDWTITPLTDLLAGNPRSVLENLWLTLKMFTFRGDPLVAYNLPERPVFVPWWTSLFFYAGLMIALWRWRQPVYAFLLIWLPVTLAPTILTVSAPHFNRTITAQIPVMVLSSLPLLVGLEWLWGRNIGRESVPLTMRQLWGQGFQRGILVLVVLTLGLTGFATWRDYFQVWPREVLLMVQYNLYLSEMAEFLSQNPPPEPILMNSRNLEDADPYILTSELGEPFRGRWVDTAQALAFPAGQDAIELWLADERFLNNVLAEWAKAELLAEQDHFTRFRLHLTDWPVASGSLPYLPSSVTWLVSPAEMAPVAPLPLVFAGQVALVGSQLTSVPARPGDVLTVLTFWQTLQDGKPQSLATFVHLLDAQGNIVAQQDGLGYPPHTWLAGDRFVHVHTLQLDAALSAGTYWVQLGLYQREDGQRWPLVDANGVAIGDRVLLFPLTLPADS
ncbi:MAG: hypothetical protein KA314_04010 [Chloroflexi bacterium]|nr:hypothetical protein [Chloroflexota bacterium]MBP8054976.1 hypothetical protein [Chloroflexota bacterium]